jgi:hypothetical protein
MVNHLGQGPEESDCWQVLGIPRGDEPRCQDRALAVQGDETNAAGGVALADAFREHRHPGARRNRQQRTLDLSVWYFDQRRRNAGMPTGRQNSVMKWPINIAGKHDYALWGDLIQADMRLHGVIVIHRKHRHSSLRPERCHANSVRGKGQRHDSGVQLTCSHRVDKLAA